MTASAVPADAFRNKRALITGGVGFLGSNVALALVELGAQVTLVDAMIPGYGGNLFNIAPIRDRVTVNFSDIRDAHVMNYLVRDQDFVFHLAGQVDHILSLTDPFPDIDINVKGTAVVMEACRHHNPEARIVYTGTRGQYGKPARLPVSETAATQPLGIYEITNLAAEKIIEAYHLVFGVRSVLLRMTNTYGPRGQMQHSRYGVVNWFIRLALDGETIPVFGDGKILRDYVYVEDAVEAILRSAASEPAYGQVLNVGVDQPTDFTELADTIVRLAQSGDWRLAPFTPERQAQEPGNFYSDITKIHALIGWSPRTSLAEGLARTIDYYREHRAQYWQNMIQFTNGPALTKLVPLRGELSEVRHLLAEHLPWGPLDFIPGISRKGDRAIQAEQWTGELAEEHDLRFRGTLGDGSPVAILAEALPWDSDFFGFSVARLNGIFPLEAPWHRPMANYAGVLASLVHKAARRGVRYLLAPVDPRDLALIRAMGELAFVLIETRYYQHGPVADARLPDRFPVRKAREEDIPSLARAASQTVNPYDRFHADPFIKPQDAARLMEKWVERSVRGILADVTIVPDVPEPSAFVTYRYHRDRWCRWGVNLVQGVLSAVSPEFMGWMGKLGPEVNLHLRSIGADYSYGSTQATNRSIIWFAQEGGARFGKCEHMFRTLL